MIDKRLVDDTNLLYAHTDITIYYKNDEWLTKRIS